MNRPGALAAGKERRVELIATLCRLRLPGIKASPKDRQSMWANHLRPTGVPLCFAGAKLAPPDDEPRGASWCHILWIVRHIHLQRTCRSGMQDVDF